TGVEIPALDLTSRGLEARMEVVRFVLLVLTKGQLPVSSRPCLFRQEYAGLFPVWVEGQIAAILGAAGLLELDLIPLPRLLESPHLAGMRGLNKYREIAIRTRLEIAPVFEVNGHGGLGPRLLGWGGSVSSDHDAGYQKT